MTDVDAKRRSLAALFAAVVLCAFVTALANDDPPTLDELVAAYFSESDAGKRAQLVGEIERLDAVTIDAVRDAIGRVDVWDPREAGPDTLTLPTVPQDPTQVLVRVPKGYATDHRYPLIVALHGQGGRADQILRYYEGLLGTRVDEFIIAAPQDYKGYQFYCTPQEATEPIELLDTLRRRYRIDTSRIYLTGYSMGGHGSFMTGILCADVYAGVMPLAGTFVGTPTEELRSLLLPNLADTPMLLVWGANDQPPPGEGIDPRVVGIAGPNRVVRQMAAESALPLTPIELPGVGHFDVRPPTDSLADFLKLERRTHLKTVSHWFRYPVQGRRDWLRLRAFTGQPWDDQMFTVRVQPDGDLSAEMLRLLKRWLGLLSGTIDGQRIEIKTKRVQELQVRLYAGMVDFTKPIQLYYQGKIRLDRVVAPRISSTLRTAYDEWEFQYLPYARLTLARSGEVRQH
ncbi:MAG: hypothetical protein IID37_04570 [Planctomycetes bacterium]|nr:hypothetical protein [Planctomycetota bacterium]